VADNRRSGHDRRRLVEQNQGRLLRAPTILLGLLVLVVLAFLAVVAVSVVLVSQRNVARTLETIRSQSEQTRTDVGALVCDVARDQALSLAGIRALAHRFGVQIARLPGEHPARCALTGDDVFIGTDGPDTIRGTPGADFISGRLGRDVLRGRGGDDAIFGDGGDDVLWANRGRDTLYGNEGDDVLNARADDVAHDVLDAGSGIDRCYGRPGTRFIGCEYVVTIR